MYKFGEMLFAECRRDSSLNRKSRAKRKLPTHKLSTKTKFSHLAHHDQKLLDQNQAALTSQSTAPAPQNARLSLPPVCPDRALPCLSRPPTLLNSGRLAKRLRQHPRAARQLLILPDHDLRRRESVFAKLQLQQLCFTGRDSLPMNGGIWDVLYDGRSSWRE
jgi:hypothetical protein